MSRPIVLVSLAALIAASLAAFAATQGNDGGPKTTAPPARAPLLVVDRTGGTLLGPSHMHLLVYTDGHVAYVSHSRAPGDDHDLTRELQPKVVAKLHSKLVAAGALELGDQAGTVTDVPLTTVTVLDGKQSTAGRTFSYWLGSDSYEPVEQALRAFVQEHVLAGQPGSEGGRR